jgi:hypothetical protein
MRVGVALGISAACVAVGAALVACLDLFHSTDDIRTACEIDAQTPGCPFEAGVAAPPEAGTDFCAWDETTARQNAVHACAWLGACETPLGRNAFGPCMFQALLAYDCAANPSHPSRGTARDLWDCLWRVKTCPDVDRCIFPDGVEVCDQRGTACGAGVGVHGNNDVRIECTDGGRGLGENCALWGQTCAVSTGAAYCAGSRGEAGLSCNVNECAGSSIHFCHDSGDLGIDCADNGGQSCAGFNVNTNSGWVACMPLQDAGACEASTSVQCAGGIASSCPAGVPEAIHCGQLLGTPDACAPGDLYPPFDWTSPCVVEGADAGPDASACRDGCSGTVLTSCERGATYTVNCPDAGLLGPCGLVWTDNGERQGARCTPPPP